MTPDYRLSEGYDNITGLHFWEVFEEDYEYAVAMYQRPREAEQYVEQNAELPACVQVTETDGTTAFFTVDEELVWSER